MATLDITEYADLAVTRKGEQVMAGQEPARANQQLNIGGTSQVSAAFDSATTFVRLHADAPCRVVFGTSPVATGAGMRLGAGQTEYLGVSSGLKVAVIETT